MDTRSTTYKGGDASHMQQVHESFFRNIDNMLIVLDEEGRILFCNTVVLEQLRYGLDELTGESLVKLQSPDRQADAVETLQKMLEGSSMVYPLPLVSSDGQLIPVETTVLRGNWDEHPALLCICKEIPLKRHNGKQKPRLLNLNATVCGFSELVGCRNVEVNNQYSKLQDLMIKIASTYINIELDKVEPVIQESLKEMAEFVDADRAYIFDYDFQKNVCNNNYEWCREGISAEIDNLQNVPLDFIPNWINIHRRGEAFYMPDIYLLPNNGPYSVRGILEPQGVKSLITLPMKLRDELVGFVGFDSVRDFHEYSEKERDLLVVFSQMLVNITERKRHAEALIEARDLAEEASRTKEVFLATMSHEIRTPLNVITGMVREMLKQELPVKQHNLLTNAKSAAVHLLSILNNILDLSKIEAGEFSLENAVFDIKRFARDVEGIMIHKATQKGLKFGVMVDSEMQTVYSGDEGRIRQVLINLMDNAMKFTETGSVIVKVWQQGMRNEKCEVHFEVRDTGIGIAPEFMDKLFSKFTQEDNKLRRKYQGTGLGMNIARNLVELMGGEINVKSVKGEGSVFHFYVLLDPADERMIREQLAHQLAAPDLTGKRILVVEDNEMNRYVVNLSLKALNCTIVEAENGQQAVDILTKECFDLIIMDIQMPVMDGLEATMYIRNVLKLKVPIIALTANAFKHNLERFVKAGMDNFIIKPYLEQDLYQVLTSLIPSTQSVNVLRPDAVLYDIRHLRSICKEDESFMQNMMRIFIKVAHENVPLFQSLREAGDFVGIRKLAHKLKPSIDNLGLDAVKDKIRTLEKADPELLSIDMVYTLMDDITSTMIQVAQQLNDYLESNR